MLYFEWERKHDFRNLISGLYLVPTFFFLVSLVTIIQSVLWLLQYKDMLDKWTSTLFWTYLCFLKLQVHFAFTDLIFLLPWVAFTPEESFHVGGIAKKDGYSSVSNIFWDIFLGGTKDCNCNWQLVPLWECLSLLAVCGVCWLACECLGFFISYRTSVWDIRYLVKVDWMESSSINML